MKTNYTISFMLIVLSGILFTKNISAQSNGQLVNHNATFETKSLKNLLDSLYGKKIISGQVDDKYLQYIKEVTGGKQPAIMGYDFNGICPSQGGNSDAAKAIDWVKNKGGIAQFQWHWISPNADGDFYTQNYKLAAALADTNSSSYKNLIRDIDLVAKEMKKMQDVGTPILWRPLHEAEGKWFWWGMAGGDACKKLYRLMYNRLVSYHKLNNLIWVWNSYGSTKENWYPGDDVVDIIAWDYPDYSSYGSWNQYQKLFGAKGKLFGVGEDGKLTDPAILASQHWLYFLTWSYMIQEPSQKDGKNPKDWVFQVYNDPRVITLDDLQKGTKAFAGPSLTVYDINGDGVEEVTLDGSASRTDNGRIVSYTWKENGIEIATGVKPTIKLSLGVHTISLTITTSLNETKTGYVVHTVKIYSLSLNKNVKASSTEANLGNVPANAVDGNNSTRWSSSYLDPQWFQVDLGKSYNINEVVISWEVASAKTYTIETSEDGFNWDNIGSRINMPTGARIDSIYFNSGKGRYIRMLGMQRNTSYGYSIWEFEVYGNDAYTSVISNDAVVFDYKLGQNFPNPFNPGTVINWQIPDYSHVTLKVYDILGREIATLVDDFKQPGIYKSQFSPVNSSDYGSLPSGLYFYTLRASAFTESKKMMFIK